MKKIVEWLKVRTMPILLAVCGMVYLLYYDEQDLYGIADIRNVIAETKEKYGSDRAAGSDDGNEAEDLTGAEVRPGADGGGKEQPGEDSLSGDDLSGGSPAGDGSGRGSAEGDAGHIGNGGNFAENDAEGASGGTDGEPAFRNPEDVVYGTVTEDYFSDAVFIGDSRTVGMYEYGGLEDIATFYASTGLTVYKMFDADIVEIPGQREKANIEQMLTENRFSKIYLMIGINEMGTGTVDSFTEKYAECLGHLRELQPDAIIYIQAIMKVTTERSEQGDYITNEGIDERNERIKELADNVNIYYLDVNPFVCDETGGLTASYTSDGVHLKAKYIDIWKQFLMEHAVQN